MNELNCFDIDDTIVSSDFPALTQKAEIQTLKQKILNTPLNSDFVEYYKLFSHITGVKSYFITGRRKKDFFQETLAQLEILNLAPEQIIFFPDNYKHSKIRYRMFKIYHIIRLANKHKGSNLYVYDDNNSYYAQLFDYGLCYNIPYMRFYLVKNHEDFWNRKLREL